MPSVRSFRRRTRSLRPNRRSSPASSPSTSRSEESPRRNLMNLKVLQLNESHSNVQHVYPEAMLVTDGRINLLVDGQAVAVNAGGMYVVPPGMPHTVVSGSDGTLVIFE